MPTATSPLGCQKTIATRVESTYSNLRPFSFVNLKIKLCESAQLPCTANRAVKVPVCCLPIGQQQPPTSRAKHGECCCYRWLLKFEVKRLAAWCGGLQRLHLGVARHPKVSGMLSPQVCRVDLWGCDNKFGDLDHRLTTVIDLKLSQIQTYQTFNLIRCTGATSRQLFIISARKCLSQSMDHHWCFPMKSLSVCLKLRRRRNPWISSAPGCWKLYLKLDQSMWLCQLRHFGACSLVQNTSQFSTQVMSWPKATVDRRYGQAWGFQVSYPQPLFWHLKLLTNSHVTITCSQQPAAIVEQP